MDKNRHSTSIWNDKKYAAQNQTTSPPRSRFPQISNPIVARPEDLAGSTVVITVDLSALARDKRANVTGNGFLRNEPEPALFCSYEIEAYRARQLQCHLPSSKSSSAQRTKDFQTERTTATITSSDFERTWRAVAWTTDCTNHAVAPDREKIWTPDGRTTRRSAVSR